MLGGSESETELLKSRTAGAVSPIFKASSTYGLSWASLRPSRRMYVGLGLGAQQRRIQFALEDANRDKSFTEIVFSAGLLIEYAISLPFFFQVRYTSDFLGGALQMYGNSLMLSYISPF